MSRCMFSLFLFVASGENISKQCHLHVSFGSLRILWGNIRMTWDVPLHSDKLTYQWQLHHLNMWIFLCLTWGYSSYVIVYHMYLRPLLKTTCQSGIVASPYVQNEKHQNSLMASPPRHRGIRWEFFTVKLRRIPVIPMGIDT